MPSTFSRFLNIAVSIYFFSPGYYRSNNYYYHLHYTVKTLKFSLNRFLSLAQRNHWNYVVIIIQKSWSYCESNDSQMYFFWTVLVDWVATEPWGFLWKGHLSTVNTTLSKEFQWIASLGYSGRTIIQFEIMLLVYRCRCGDTNILRSKYFLRKPPTERCDPLELVPGGPLRGNLQLLHNKQCWIGSL